MATLTVDKKDPSTAAMIIAKLAGVPVQEGNGSSLKVGTHEITGSTSVDRALARYAKLYGSDAITSTEVDHWVGVAGRMKPLNSTELAAALKKLNDSLKLRTFLVGHAITLADAAVFSALIGSSPFANMSDAKENFKNVFRWMNTCKSVDAFASVASKYTVAAGSAQTGVKGGIKSEGKFFNLKGAKEGEVVTRFPPEASGFLHIGHAKAAFTNQYLAKLYKGKMILRFDDTNPAKESEEFEKAILDDLKLLGVTYDQFTRTSDHFDYLLTMVDKLITEAKAFVDNTPPEEMTATRMAAKPSPLRDTPPEENMRLWKEMQKASEEGLKCIVRIKIDPTSENGAMRDPPIYRCKPEPHLRTGTKYKVYPLYDFACPLVDSREGVTHALRTTEYHDRNPQYVKICEACGIRCPEVEDFSRMDMQYTCLAKRQLRWFVNNKKVDGWTDPRFPTVRGILRRGLTVEGLRKFIIEMGSSKSASKMSWDKIWSFNRQVIDPVAPRHTALVKLGYVSATLVGESTRSQTKPLHPKNPAVGTRTTYIAEKVLVQLSDANMFEEGMKVTLMEYGNVIVKSIEKTCGIVTSLVLTPALSDQKFDGTMKVTFIADCPEESTVPITCFQFGHLITLKGGVNKKDGEEGLARAYATDSKQEFSLVGTNSLATLQRGDIIQLNRLGYWVCDQAYNKDLNRPVHLFSIPDGKDERADSLLKQASTIPVSDAMLTEAKEQLSSLKEAQVALKKGKADQDTKQANQAKVTAATAILKVLESLVKLSGGASQIKNESKQAEQAAPAIPAASTASQGDGAEILAKVEAQGAIVRQLKEKKAGKDEIKAAVGVLLQLKTDYKTATGQDVPAPGKAPAKSKAKATVATKKSASVEELAQKIRDLKAANGSEAEVKAAVKAYQDAKASATKPSGAASGDGAAILEKISSQGEVVRGLKANKASKDDIMAAVDILKKLKEEYKTKTGEDVPTPPKSGGNKERAKQAPTPKAAPAPAPAPEVPEAGKPILAEIQVQAGIVKTAKADKVPQEKVKEEVAKLLALKAKFKEVTGMDVPGGAPRPAKKEKKKAKKQQSAEEKAKALAAQNQKGQTKLGISAKKEDDFAGWYSEVITKAEMIEYYDVSGCYILRPLAYSIWDQIHDFFDAEIKKLGVNNCYFPLFVPRSALEKEKDHIEDFAPEVAWVTKSGESDLAEPIAIRPTSETVMYPAFKKWIRSHRDLPMKLNQWCNVVRWEFKHPQPFLRTREFLWQEGHTVFAKKPEAEEEVMNILDLYTQVYQDLLAVPVVRGRKTEKEKFAGGDYTTTVEAYIATAGRSIQGATSHHLGQNFAKMFEIEIQDPDAKASDAKQYVYQNSWGLTTRTIGVMVMVHGDDKGLVIPPRVSQLQVICIPTGLNKNSPVQEIVEKISEFEQTLRSAGIRCDSDVRENYTPAWKWNHYEVRGVPIRLELGPRDMEKKQVIAVRRDTGQKIEIAYDNIVPGITGLLEQIQTDMYAKACKSADEHLVECYDWAEFVPVLNEKNLLLVPFCGDKECEGRIKDDSAKASQTEGEEVDEGAPSMGAKSLCIPFVHQNKLKPGMKCIHPACNSAATCITMFGRSY